MAAKKKAPKKRPICDVHYELGALGEELENFDFDKPFKRDIKGMAKDIQRLAEEARGYGQSMEDRLSEYRSAIEDLGFKRKAKK
jgi:hypothetical protein